MFKERGKIREIKETLEAYGEVKEGDDYFQTTEKLRKELGGLQGTVRKQALGALVLVVLGGSAVWHYLTKSGEEEAHDKSVATAPSSPGPDSSSGQDARADYPEGKKDFHYDLQDRIIDLLKRFLPQSEIAKKLNEIIRDPDYLLTEKTVIYWEKELGKFTENFSDEYSGKSLFQFFRNEAVPNMKDVPVQAGNLLQPGEFFVNRVEDIGKSDKRAWFNEHRVPYYDKEFKFLALPKVAESSDGYQGEDYELALFAIQDLIKDKRALIGRDREVSNYAKTILAPFLFINKEFEAHLLNGDSNVLDWLIVLEREILKQKNDHSKMSLEEKNRKIGKTVYLDLRALESLKDPRLDKVRPFFRKVIENPEVYLSFMTKNPDLDNKVLKDAFKKKRHEVIARTYGEEQAKSDDLEIENHPDFNDFLRRFMVPTLQNLKLKSVSDYDEHLAKFFQEGAVAADIAAQNKSYKLAKDEFFVSDLDNDKGDPRKIWMKEHGIPYSDVGARTLYLPKYPHADQVERVFYCLKALDSAGSKESLFENHHGKIIEIIRNAHIDIVEYVTKTSGVNQMLSLSGIEGMAEAVSLTLKTFGMNILTDKSIEDRSKAVEKEAYKILMYLLDMDDPRLKDLMVLLREIANKPHVYLTLSEKDKAETHPELFR